MNRIVQRASFQVHLWIGLSIGLYVAVLSATGAILVFRSELQRATAAFSGGFKLPEVVEGVAKVAVRHRKVRRELQRVTVAGDRLIEAAAVLERVAEVDVGFGVVGQRFLRLLQHRQGIAAADADGDAQSLPAKAKVRVLLHQLARCRLKLGVTPGVEKGDQLLCFR